MAAEVPLSDHSGVRIARRGVTRAQRLTQRGLHVADGARDDGVARLCRQRVLARRRPIPSVRATTSRAVNAPRVVSRDVPIR